eukprot:TRINITY_DN1556_c2_g1_i1.p1 TRINITY_DN1556_c2_g1~~TRINITY_DN1556_c2_g1_i1.p1  ORF type:complete len:546 (-),score=111.93 TRINITY_DN1556_c2_g1_i1:259-1896(-)
MPRSGGEARDALLVAPGQQAGMEQELTSSQQQRPDGSRPDPSFPADDDEVTRLQEQSPAYRALHDNHLICSRYRVRRAEELDLIGSNASAETSTVCCCLTCNGLCGVMKFFTVDSGCVQKAKHSDGRYLLFGQGVHQLLNGYFVSLTGSPERLTQGVITHGTKAIVTVEQGFVGLAMDRGQPLLLPPGLHQWDSSTIQFDRLIDLSTAVIKLGPYTLVTVDEGYAAVTQDNGAQKVLEGGQTYMLTHRNWKFEKFITKKLQSLQIGPITVSTGDNVPLQCTASVNWIIEDVPLAARMAANTMFDSGVIGNRQQVAVAGHNNSTEFDISKLRADVLQQVTASLAAFIGSLSYSAHGNAKLSEQVGGSKNPPPGGSKELEPEEKGAKALFDRDQLFSSVEHANEICSRYGVKILSINLISAYPADKSLMEALSQGAVATVAAEQTETAARGQAQAMLLKAKAESEADRIRAEGAAAAEELRAEGSLKAARTLETSDVAVLLAKMKTAGHALGEANANSFFFGLSGPADVSSGVLGTALMAEASASKK